MDRNRKEELMGDLTRFLGGPACQGAADSATCPTCHGQGTYTSVPRAWMGLNPPRPAVVRCGTCGGSGKVKIEDRDPYQGNH